MSIRSGLLACAGASMLLSLSGCLEPASAADAQAEIFPASASHAGNGYQVQGWGWKPGSKVSISMFDEPNGPGTAASEWRHLFDVTADANGMFGFTTGSAFHPVNRNICGQPEQGQVASFQAKADTGRIRVRQTPVDIYYTFQRC
jgi:hypothetical protein